MVYKWQCNLSLQDCAKLYPSGGHNGYGYIRNPFTNESCVRDQRLEGNVGRCGFPGAKCKIDANGSHNCADGNGINGNGFAPTCRDGVCVGGAGSYCIGNGECNWGIMCNATLAPGVCGGAYAYMGDSEAADGLDFGRDYCLSGHAIQNDQGYWICAPGPAMALTSPPAQQSASATRHGASVGAIVGGVVGGVAAISVTVVLLWLLVRKRRQKVHQKRDRPDLLADTNHPADTGLLPDANLLANTSEMLPPPQTYPVTFGPPIPANPYDTDAVERRLIALRDEAERGLAEIRAQRSGQALTTVGPAEVIDRELRDNPPAYQLK